MIRLKKLVLNNFKNVQHGEIDFPFGSFTFEKLTAALAGIYGQNGSGKTSVIDALLILRTIFRGDPLNNEVREMIAISEQSSDIELTFELLDRINPSNNSTLWYQVSYSFSFGRSSEGVEILSERISFKDMNQKSSQKTLIEWSSQDEKDLEDLGSTIPCPRTAWKPLFSASDFIRMEYRVARRMAKEKSCSTLFSDNFMDSLRHLRKTEAQEKTSKAFIKALNGVVLPLGLIVTSVKLFALSSFEIVTTKNHAITSLNIIRIPTISEDSPSWTSPYLAIDISEPSKMKEEHFEILRQALVAINKVLGALVPGLSLDVLSLGDELDADGNLSKRVELVSARGGKPVPFRCESEGIKKIVSISTLLIRVFSDPRACVAIDELDAGVYEFLLGEILEVLEENGTGQLIFTAHNLRPLETLSEKSLIFTTTNPRKRYIKFKGLGKTNNLRDQYIKAINLGGQSEVIYEPTSKYEIDDAFYSAGLAMRSLMQSQPVDSKL